MILREIDNKIGEIDNKIGDIAVLPTFECKYFVQILILKLKGKMNSLNIINKIGVMNFRQILPLKFTLVNQKGPTKLQ